MAPLDHRHHPKKAKPQPLIDENREGEERRPVERNPITTVRRTCEYDPSTDTAPVNLVEFQAPTPSDRDGIMFRIAKALSAKPRDTELFSIDTLPIFRQLAQELFQQGWIPTIRKNAFDRFGTPVYPWMTFGESEKVAENGRFIALTRMPRNMKASRFIKPMDPKEVIDAAEAEELGFGPFYSRTSHITIATCDTADKDTLTRGPIDKPSGNWDGEVVIPNIAYECVPLEQVKQYGTGLFDGIGVEANEDGEVVVFRLKEHWQRMSKGGEFLGMPPIPYELFERMVMKTIQANWAYIPPAGKGRLYIRPDWFDHGAQMHVGNSERYTLLMCAVAIGSAESYFKKGRKKFLMAKGRARVAEGGNIGWIKMDGNYAPTIDLIKKADAKNMAGVIFTNSAGDRIEETNASSVIFIKKNTKTIITPSLDNGTILDSVTRKTILKWARENGWNVEERDISPDELATMAKEGDMEAIAVGTAAAIAPIHEIQVGSVNPETNEISEDGELIQISPAGEKGRGEISTQIFKAIMDMKSGKAQKRMRAELKTKEQERSRMGKGTDTNQIDTEISELRRKLEEQEDYLTIVPSPENAEIV